MYGPVKTHYDNLKVARNAPPEVIRAAYKVLAQKYHPDLNLGNADADRVMKLVNVAYDTLSDPIKRREHDNWIAERERPTANETPMRDATVGEQMRSSYGADIPRSQQHKWRAADGPPRRHVDASPIVIIGIALIGKARVGFRAAYNLVVGAFVVMMGLGLTLIAVDMGRKVFEGLPTPTPVVQPTPVTAPAILPKYARPSVAPNGYTWPARSGYVNGYPIANRGGRSSLTIDNRQGGSEVFVKVHSLAGENEEVNVRHFYIAAGGMVRASQLSAGGYDIRYQSLDDGTLARSEPFVLSETVDGDVIRFSEMTLTIYRVKNGNSRTYPLAAGEF